MATNAISEADWIKGIALSVAASVIGGGSKLAIRKSWLLEQQQHEPELVPDYDDITDEIVLPRRRFPFPLLLRVTGMFGMTVLNPLCCVLAMNYASPSILVPFSGLTLVWIVLCSQPLIGESPSMQQVIAAALIVLGEVTVAIFGDHTNDEGVTVDDVVRFSLCSWRRL